MDAEVVAKEPLSYLAAVLLGIVQGLTEFLPVSSSGHLALAKPLIGFGEDDIPMLFDILLHVATVIVVFGTFWKDFWNYLTRQRSVVAWIVIACVPTALGGLIWKHRFEAIGKEPVLVALMLILSAAILYCSAYIQTRIRPLENLGAGRSLFVGAMQCVAITPGISRSGTTIVAGMFAGLSRDEAVRFSFALMVPAVLGATVLEFFSKMKGAEKVWDAEMLPAGPCAAGFAAALVVGFLSLRFLRWIVRGGKLSYFGHYCAAAGLAGLAYFGFAA